jgi:hypothetical protein
MVTSLASLKGQRDMARTTTQSPFAPTSPVQRSTNPTAFTPLQGADDRKPQEDRIRFRAYLLAEAAGFPAGRADEFWLQAEREIRSGKSR